MNARGVTLLELLVTVSIILVLASVAVPLQKMTSKRTQELELRQKLREMRTAIDDFRRDWARDGDVMTGQLCVKNKATCKEVSGIAGHPKSLKNLLGVEFETYGNQNDQSQNRNKDAKPFRRYLRRIPVDPITGTAEWALRCYKDPPDLQEWCGEDVFDVYPRSFDVALDGTRYRDW